MSENIFKEIYSKVLSLFKQTEKVDENAKDVAKNRLRVVLMQDRTNLTPELLQRMRGELIELLSKYVEMDKEALELNFDQEGDQMALMLSIPVLRAKDEAEIEKALTKEEEEEEKDTEEIKDIEENSDETEEDSEEKSDGDSDISEQDLKEESETNENSEETKTEEKTDKTSDSNETEDEKEEAFENENKEEK